MNIFQVGTHHNRIDRKPSGIKSKSGEIMISGSKIGIYGETFNDSINHASRGMDILMEWVSIGAFKNSDDLYDAPKCHCPHTRVAVLDDIMDWVGGSESARDDFMLWLFGPAGAGKSAIAKRIAEIAAERGILIAKFFFSRTSPTRGTKDRLIATLAYQLTVSIPDTRSYIEYAIEQDPAIFNKNLQTQIDTLLIKPFISSTQTAPSKNLIIIDGIDECSDRQAQVAILEAICCSFTQHNLPIKFLLVSRPEPDLVTSFNCNEPLKSLHRRLALDDTYMSDDDIRLFFSDKFEQIRLTHPLKSTIPISWPTQEILKMLIEKSSGQFIYASTVVKFVESTFHRPSARLNIILGISPRGRTKPFAELDALYNYILSSVDDIRLTMHVLSLYVMTPKLASVFHDDLTMPPELFLSLGPGDIHLSLINLSFIITYHESTGRVEILHASLVDFLSDKHRSTIFCIDMASTCTDFVRRILQYVKGPDGIQAGDIHLFRKVVGLSPGIPKGQLRSEIMNFDLDAFINASVKWIYQQHSSRILVYTIEAFWIWKKFLDNAVLEDSDKKEALDQLNKSFESRLQTYRSDSRLQLLLTLAAARVGYKGKHGVPCCRCVDILLDIRDAHDLHIIDQHALDIRHMYGYLLPWCHLIPPVDGDTYASAALHCMRFISNPPTYSEKNEEMDLTCAEWKETCAMTLKMLRRLLKQANTLPELVQFISNHDIHPAIQRSFSADRILEVNVHILAFLRQANVCPNWRIISAIQQSLVINDQPSKFDENDEGDELTQDWEITWDLMQQRLDQCCSNTYHVINW